MNAALERDYRQLREAVGAYRLPRDVVAVHGPDAASYLQGQCSQDLDGLEVGSALETLLLAPDGKVELLARVARSGEEVFHLDTDAGFAGRLIDRLARFKLRSKLEIEPTDWTCIALRGPAAAGQPGLSAAVLAAVDVHSWLGIDLLGPEETLSVPASVPWCGAAAWEAARIESGLPVMGRELIGGEIPAETGTVERAVSFTKGCFTGQELVARIDSRGGSAPRRLCGLVLEGPADPDSVVGAELHVPGKDRPVGRVTSAAECPGLGAVGALAYLHRSVQADARVELTGTGATGGQARRAVVRPLPMV
jgi:folate-binding protein YgfZ